MKKILAEVTFQGRVALVTGGNSGIGRAAALVFAEKGAKVVVADLADTGDTVNLIKEAGGEAMFIKCDVSKDAEVQAMIAAVISTYGRLDCAFNNAGIEGVNIITHESSEENWNKVIDVNLKGVWLCMKYELPLMLQQGKGAIVNNASIAGMVAFPGIPAYVASKHGVIGLTQNAALEYARQQIRVNAICPGVIKTPMVERFTGNQPAVEEQFSNLEPIGRIGMPEEVAGAAVWLCSDEASFITGVALPVDGGWTAQ